MENLTLLVDRLGDVDFNIVVTVYTLHRFFCHFFLLLKLVLF